MLRPHLLSFLAAVLLSGTALVAQGTTVAFGSAQQDRDLPVEVAADQLAVNQNDGTAIFTGNVRIDQGEMKMSTPRVLVIYNEDNSGIDRLEATGGVIIVSGPDAAEAEAADYNIDTGTIVMRGNVLLTQGSNATSSDEATVFLDEGTARMIGRVRTVLRPDGDD